MVQVPPQRLAIYLREKREQGFTIVALEQTAKSVSLERFRFPEKTVILVGNEQNGVPPELLAMIDQAVEIPQLGVIRSLNAHVSTAVCVWEYTSQHMQQRARE